MSINPIQKYQHIVDIIFEFGFNNNCTFATVINKIKLREYEEKFAPFGNSYNVKQLRF